MYVMFVAIHETFGALVRCSGDLGQNGVGPEDHR